MTIFPGILFTALVKKWCLVHSVLIPCGFGPHSSCNVVVRHQVDTDNTVLMMNYVRLSCLAVCKPAIRTSWCHSSYILAMQHSHSVAVKAQLNHDISTLVNKDYLLQHSDGTHTCSLDFTSSLQLHFPYPQHLQCSPTPIKSHTDVNIVVGCIPAFLDQGYHPTYTFLSLNS